MNTASMYIFKTKLLLKYFFTDKYINILIHKVIELDICELSIKLLPQLGHLNLFLFIKFIDFTLSENFSLYLQSGQLFILIYNTTRICRYHLT